MQFTITISGEKSELADGLAVLKAVMGEQIGEGSVTAEIEKPKKDTKRSSTKPEAKADPAEDVQEEEVVQESIDVGDSPSPADLRAKAQELGATKRAEVKALLNEFEVANITSVPEDRRIEFMTRLEAL